MKKILFNLFALLSVTFTMSAAVDGKFSYSYPPENELPYDLGYQFPKIDLPGSTEKTGWELMTLKKQVTLTYNITSEDKKTVEVVFDPSYMDLEDIVIPEKVKDGDTEYTVTAIGKMAFDDCPNIRSVIMGNTITEIGDYAFNMCENKVLHHLGYVKFSTTLTHIGNYAFKNCHNLTNGYFTEGDQKELVAKDKLEKTDVPAYGFGGRRTGIDDYLILPASVEYIGKHAFEGCYFELEGTVLNYGLCKVKIPNPSCVIDDYAFAGCELLELVTIGDELTYDGLTNPNPATNTKGRIGDYAFANCNLMRLDIPSSIAKIGDNAFINCFKRKNEKTKNSREGQVYFTDMQWYYPRSLFNNEDDRWDNWNDETTSTQYSDTSKMFQEYLDRWHTNTVTIHSSNTEIGINAFADNPKLKTVKILGSSAKFEAGTFRNCPELSSVELPEDLTRLSSSMFMNCSALDKITIPDKVSEIGDSAFYMCETLRTLELPSNLTKVNPYTFYGCKLLLLDTLPGEVSSIGNHAFFGCKEITSFTIPNKVTTIGDYAFADCYLHEFSRISDVSSWHYGLTNIKFGDGVQTIGAHAFDGCRHLGTIEMGKNITEIGDYAFQNCMSCPEDDCKVENNELTLPDCLTKMGTGAFQGCIYLPGITLGNNMTELPDFAFAHCSNLSNIENIAKITSAKENTFLGCYNLEDFGNLYKDKGNLIDGIIYNDNCTEVISALPNIKKADLSKTNVVKIHDGAFANCGALSKVSFPETLEEIGSRAFENCTSLQSADLINVKMGEFVYAGCTGITTVFIAQDFTQDLQDNWFAGCIYMEGICVAEENIRYSSFEETFLLNKDEDTLLRAPSGIYELYFPESVTKIGDYACSNCINLDYVEIPPTVKHIGAHAFDGCYYEEVDNNGKVLNYWGLQSVNLKNPAVTIDDYAFNNCKRLNDIYWSVDAEPGDMGSIGAFAFNNCEKLKFATDNLKSAAIGTIKPYAFANFPGIEDIVLPETLETIGDHAFENCEYLKSVVFPTSLVRIGNSAFKSTSLTSLDFSANKKIVEIGDSAFMDCSKVMNLKLPSSLKKINPYTFYKCFSESEFVSKPQDNNIFNPKIEIPNSVESIGDYAFYGCKVNSRKYHLPDANTSFKHTYSDLHYVFNYGIASVSIGNGVKSIGAHAFDGCTHLVEVTMGDAVTSIGDYAFNNCFSDSFNGVKDLEITLTGQIVDKSEFNKEIWKFEEYTPKAISLPSNLQTLGEGAFNGCVELPSINFPATLESIPDMAFNGCSNLPKIELSEGLKSIGDRAFAGCSGVTEIYVPASLEKGSRVFVDCEKALNVYYYAQEPKEFDEGFFSPKVYSSEDGVVHTPNALLAKVKGINPWALFYKIEAKDETLIHLERVLETKNGLRFRVLSNKPNPYCEVAGPAKEATGPTTYDVPEYVTNIDKNSPYFGLSYKVIRIGNDAFENDLTLVGINIPESVFDIGQEAFNGCKNLPEINLPKSITNMGERAFANCYGLTYFAVPELVTRLNPEVLKDCRGLYSIRMHDNIEELCMGALMDCRHLQKFERSQNWKLRLIDDYALKNCIELEEINIPEGVEKIGKEAMYYCQKLKTVTLPKTLLELGEKTFDDCEELTRICVYTETPPKMIGERHLTDQNCKIYVQAKYQDVYKDLWPVHAHRIEPGIEVTQPQKEEMPKYVPESTYTIKERRALTGQSMTWSSNNEYVASPHSDHDGKIVTKGVGRAHIKVETDHKFYHECDIEVYPQSADANWDGNFDISDAVNIANYIVDNIGLLNNQWKNTRTKAKFKNEADWRNFYFAGANLTGDNEITISDAYRVMKYALDQPSKAPQRKTRASDSDEDDDSDAVIIGIPEAGIIPIMLANSMEYVALQADIRVPEGTLLKDVKVGQRAANHSLSSRRIDDQTMRVMLFDLNNSAFVESDLPVLQIVADDENISAEDIQIYGIIASDIASDSYSLTARVGTDITGVDSIKKEHGFSISQSSEGVLINNAQGKKIEVFTLEGALIQSFEATANPQLVRLAPGIYILSVDNDSVKIAVR